MRLFSTVHRHTHTETAVPYEKTVHNYRAPTDESIKLVDEYIKKTQDRFISAFKLETNALGEGINATIFTFCDERTGNAMDLPNIKYLVRFKLNEKTFKHEFVLDSFELSKLRRLSEVEADEEILRMVFDILSKRIAAELIKCSGTKAIGLKSNYNLGNL